MFLCQKPDSITAHSFIAKNQSQYLRKLKEELSQNEVMVLVDFAENHNFLVQDEVQSYHWNSQQCTLHPVMIYYKHVNQVVEQSLCIISDDLTHVSFVYKVMPESINFIKQKVNPEIEKVHYFSDGCAGQYKNKKYFLNLCLHKMDFNVDCVWNFFATSHGKSSCDGIGGTVKRLATKASLQRLIDNQILNASDIYKFCNDNIKGISFCIVNDDTMNNICTSLVERFQAVTTVPSTRSYH